MSEGAVVGILFVGWTAFWVAYGVVSVMMVLSP